MNAAGVELLKYVPQNAFVARVKGVKLNALRAFPAVKWIGEYKPEYKVHRQVAAQSKSLVAGNGVGVSVLLAPQLNDQQISEVRGLLNGVNQQSSLRAGTILRGTAGVGGVEALSKSAAVLWIEPAAKMKLFDEVSSKIVAGDGGAGVLLTETYGYDGTGVKVAVADSGLNNGDAVTMHPDLLGRTPAFFYYGGLPDAADEHSHGTHVSGIIAGNGATGEVDDYGNLWGLGVAPGASIIAQRIFDGVGNYFPPTNGFSQLTKDAKSAGADIGSNSWGDDTQGRYDISAMEFDELVRDYTGAGTNNLPYILEFSAGNAGPGAQTVGSPAVAKNVIATGACENDRPDYLIYADGPEAMADFSSRGPCEDGRIKPDVVAPGTWISSLQSESATDENAWLAIDSFYQFQGGTSQAGPHASGAAAVFVQFYRATHTNATPSPALVKAALINSTVDLDDSYGTAPSPNSDEGWGRVDLTTFFESPLTYQFFEQGTTLTNGQVFESHIIVASPDEPFRVTLAYTDVPGFPAAIPALVNDLDLEVIAPDGHLYRGNQFSAGESVPDPSGPDTINNVEGIYLATPVPGEYVVRVRARAVVQDYLGRAGPPRQDFAVVLSGLVPAPGTSAVILDRGAYTAPNSIKITVIDIDQAGHPTLNASARSTTETNAENVVLTAAGVGGSFTGTVATATGPALADGKLQIANNDLITVSYGDVSAGSNRTVTAVADLVPPTLFAVYATNSFGVGSVSWFSSEPATSIVRYGTNSSPSSLNRAITNKALVTGHTIEIPGLVSGRTYYYYVVSADEAGNVSTNNNGSTYSFVAAPTAPILLVDEYYADSLFNFPAPPLSGYTAPLNQLGVKYDFWDATQGAQPTNVLAAYRAVIWRVPELSGAWSVNERVAISNYLHNGGSLFVASMQLLSRLELDASDTGFIHNVLQVQSYVADDAGSTGAEEIIGSTYETVGSGLDIAMDYQMYADLWTFFGYQIVDPADISETMTPKTNASPVFRNDAHDIVGLRWPAVGQQASGRLVFLSFPLDAAPMNGGVNDRVNLLRNALSFLAPGASGVATVSLNSPAYALPSLITVEVGDGDMAGGGTLTVNASSTTQTNPLSVTLFESAVPGVYSGSFSLISATNPPVSGKLRAAAGDAISVKYFDASSNSTVVASATVDVVPPVISGVGADPDYQAASVSWVTSEPTDALVQYGESVLLGRSAYDSDFSTTHTLTLPNLRPNQPYYYKVTSRDVAGNTTADTNLYDFKTLVPLYAPWSDSLDTGAMNWSVVSAEDVDAEWTLGVPNNGKETAAHSPPNAWGSNLGGGTIGYSETFLLSPAIYLPEGAKSMLHFWHSYKFSTESDLDILEYGQLLLITNSDSTTAITLAEYTDDETDGWVEQPIDLSAYAGQLVYLVWDYELLTFDDARRPGWLVDDVSITVSNSGGGVIRVTNNLWQAAWTLSGPTNYTRSGISATFSNVPAGQYSISYSPVSYYVAPGVQTNTLAAGGSVTFTGNYTFPDTNHNGISDLWEQRFFGNVSSNRTQVTDTDGDGLSDYAEFLAGTDPENPPRKFVVSASVVWNAYCRLKWASTAGQQYRVVASTNLTAWTNYTSWIEAAGTNCSTDVALAALGKRAFFRVEAWSTNSPAGMPQNFKLTVQSAGGGAVKLQWPTAVGRGYRVDGSTNGVSWAGVSAWTQAVTTNMSWTSPPPSPTTPRLFRVEVLP